MKPDIQKDAERLGNLHAQQEKIFVKHFMAFIHNATSEPAFSHIKSLVQAHNIEGVLRHTDTHIEHLSNVLADVFINAGQHESDIWHERLQKIDKARRFNITDRRISNTLARNRINFSLNLSRQQRSVIRSALIDGIRKGETPDQIARRFRNTIGLNSQQHKAVDSYRRSLEEGNTDALERTLRNPRFDTLIETKIDTNDPLTSKQIERMVGSYTRNLQIARAQTIAETESLKIINQARDNAVRQIAEAEQIQPTKTWLLTSSAEPRETHLAVVGETIGIDEAFSVGGVHMLYPGDSSLGAGPDNLVHCKCGISYSIGE